MNLLSFFLFLSTVSALIAFPGAEGFGANAIGSRGGQVYVVTNLNDTGQGSLRDAVSETDRIVVFAVGGVIDITDRIVVSKRVTILGQTAPGDGITVYGNGWPFSNADDAISHGQNGDPGKDAITIAEGKNMIFDHVSVSWGLDETFSISGTGTNITVQNSIISQGLVSHSCGGLMQTDGGISLFRNLYIDNKTRNPKVKGVNDFTNNVVYNWGSGGGYIAGGSSGESYANIVGNYFISGPSTGVSAFLRENENFHGFVKNNYNDPDQDGTLNGFELAVESVMSPEDTVKYICEYVGASHVRDSVDAALVKQLQSWGTAGALISNEDDMGGPGDIAGGTKRLDTDSDGIPDEIEKKLGTIPMSRIQRRKITVDIHTWRCGQIH